MSATEGTTEKRLEEQAKTLEGITMSDGSKHDQHDELPKNLASWRSGELSRYETTNSCGVGSS